MPMRRSRVVILALPLGGSVLHDESATGVIEQVPLSKDTLNDIEGMLWTHCGRTASFDPCCTQPARGVIRCVGLHTFPIEQAWTCSSVSLQISSLGRADSSPSRKHRTPRDIQPPCQTWRVGISAPPAIFLWSNPCYTLACLASALPFPVITQISGRISMGFASARAKQSDHIKAMVTSTCRRCNIFCFDAGKRMPVTAQVTCFSLCTASCSSLLLGKLTASVDSHGRMHQVLLVTVPGNFVKRQLTSHRNAPPANRHCSLHPFPRRTFRHLEDRAPLVHASTMNSDWVHMPSNQTTIGRKQTSGGARTGFTCSR